MLSTPWNHASYMTTSHVSKSVLHLTFQKSVTTSHISKVYDYISCFKVDIASRKVRSPSSGRSVWSQLVAANSAPRTRKPLVKLHPVVVQTGARGDVGGLDVVRSLIAEHNDRLENWQVQALPCGGASPARQSAADVPPPPHVCNRPQSRIGYHPRRPTTPPSPPPVSGGPSPPRSRRVSAGRAATARTAAPARPPSTRRRGPAGCSRRESPTAVKASHDHAA
jgi:hypothetical protein